MIENGNFLLSGVYRIAILNLKMNSNVRNPSFQVGHGNIISIDSSCEIKISNIMHILCSLPEMNVLNASTFLLRSSFFVSNHEKEGASFHF